MLEVLLHALKHTALLLPFLFAVHMLIGLFEAKKLDGLKNSRLLRGGFAPLIGTGVALLPQCGFSVVASELYSKKYITVGTLIATFIATSDEALPIFIGHAVADVTAIVKLLLLIGIKVAMALALGYALDIFFRRREKAVSESDGKVSEEVVVTHAHGCCGHHVGESDENRSVFAKYFKHPLIHTGIITLFVFAVNFMLETIIFVSGGEENFVIFMSQSVFLQPLLAVAIGLIPNCASSVIITEMYISGALTLGAGVAGLAVNAGLGVAVLFKENKNLKKNFFILVGMIVYALAVGYLVTAVETLL